MGAFDWVEVVAGDAGCEIAPGEMFQTKCILPCMARYQITESGELVWEGTIEPIPYHGDFKLIRIREHEPAEFVVRFTDGKLEWIRPLAEYPDNLRKLKI